MVFRTQQNGFRGIFAVFVAVFAILVLFLWSDAVAQQNIESEDELLNLARQLVALRSDVESLSSELDRKKAEMRDQINTLTAQKSELEIQIRNEELKLKQIEQAIKTVRNRIETEKVDNNNLKPLVLEQSKHLKTYIQNALPFKTEGRLSEIVKIEEQLAQDKMEPEKALAQLWALLEDEFRLSGESGLYCQSIELEGEELIVDIARLGMVLLYFKTCDDRVGYVVREGDSWRYTVISDKENRKRVIYLFDSLKKRIREGFYELPNTL